MAKSTELIERLKLAREEKSTTSEAKPFQMSVTLSEKNDDLRSARTMTLENLIRVPSCDSCYTLSISTTMWFVELRV